MVITIEAKCRRCANIKSFHVTVADWSVVRPILNIKPAWKCPVCDCKAAYWYYCRNVSMEGVPNPEDYTQQTQQLVFAYTNDKNEGYDDPPNFVSEKIHPITREELP